MSVFNSEVFGQRVRRRMEMYSKRQEALAKTAGCSRQVIVHYINGRSEPTASTLIALSDELQCTVDYLVGKTSAPNPQKELAMDKLDLSAVAVAVINGESPHRKRFLQTFNGLSSDELEKNLNSLSERQPDIHKITAAALEHPDFESAMQTLQRACEFETVTYQAQQIKTLVDGLLLNDDSVKLLPDGMYAVPRNRVVDGMKATIMRHLEKMVDDLIKQNTTLPEDPKR